MKFRALIDTEHGATGISGFFTAYGSFGIVDGADYDLAAQRKTDSGYAAEYDDFSVSSAFDEDANGVTVRKDTLTAKKDIVINKYASRFLLESGDYEIYTQYSFWQNESRGGWQKLVTSVEVSNLGVRSADGAVPMMVLKNNANGKLYVFHLIANAQWKIKAAKRPHPMMPEGVLLELGLDETYLHLSCKAGGEIHMPEVLFYEADSTIDFDAWRLHAYFNRAYPRRMLPIMFNSWLYTFDKFDIDDMFRQADAAAEIGVEMFMIDAGWFGVTDTWTDNIGEWTENTLNGFRGRLSEFSEYVRQKGMTLGLWLEPERALANVAVVKAHPAYFLRGSDGNRFLNFANDDACDHVFSVVCGLIDKYRLGCLKFDFNATLAYDETGNGFYRYFEGQKKLISRLRDRYPALYITNCASGGARMEPGQQKLFDGVWLSDNQSPVSAFRIFCDTCLRLPPSHFEKYDVRKFCPGFLSYGATEKVTLPISCDGATWSNAVIVKPDFTHAFITGGTMGFSADIAGYPEEERKVLADIIREYKVEREFYKTAVLRILHRTDKVVVLQYADVALETLVIQAFSFDTRQSYVTVYPKTGHGSYAMNGTAVSNGGIRIRLEENGAVTVKLRRIQA